jgi:hypothetical protein
LRRRAVRPAGRKLNFAAAVIGAIKEIDVEIDIGDPALDDHVAFAVLVDPGGQAMSGHDLDHQLAGHTLFGQRAGQGRHGGQQRDRQHGG